MKTEKSRITIMIEKELEKKLRNRQAELLKKSSKSVSLSKVINDCLKSCLGKKLC